MKTAYSVLSNSRTINGIALSSLLSTSSFPTVRSWAELPLLSAHGSTSRRSLAALNTYSLHGSDIENCFSQIAPGITHSECTSTNIEHHHNCVARSKPSVKGLAHERADQQEQGAQCKNGSEYPNPSGFSEDGEQQGHTDGCAG